MPKSTPVEVWFQDEARLGQKNGRVRIWAKKGTRPRLPADQRYANIYLFGAICPMRAKGAALMLPFANTDAMRRDQPQRRRQGAWCRPDGSRRMAQHRQAQLQQ